MAQLNPFDVSIDWDQHAAKCRLAVKKVGPDFHVDWTDEASVEANHKRLQAALGELAKADKEGGELLTKFAALAKSVPKLESEVAELEKRLANASAGHATIDRALQGIIATLRGEIVKFRTGADQEMHAYQLWRNALPRLVSTDVLLQHHNVNEQLLESADKQKLGAAVKPLLPTSAEILAHYKTIQETAKLPDRLSSRIPP